MWKWRVYCSLIAAAILLIAAALYSANDAVITIHCDSDSPPTCPSATNGVMLVAKNKITLMDTRVPNHDVVFSNVDPDYEQVMAFRVGYRPVYVKNVAWNSSPLTVTMDKQIDLKIRFWALCPDETGDCSHPITAKDNGFLKNFKIHANATLRSERVGIHLVAADEQLVSDVVRTDAGASDFKKFTIDKCGQFNAWVAADPTRRSLASAINIYLVTTVDAGTGRGVECSSDARKIILIGAKIDWETILHEIGHTLSLDDLPLEGVAWSGSVSENFMKHASADRKYFTEAQIFRIHVNDSSAVNTLQHPGTLPVFSCGTTDEDAKNNSCPQLRERVWPEP